MIQASFLRDRGPTGRLLEFEITGHSGLAPKGEDLLCAAVSALAQGTLVGLESVIGIEARVEIKDGFINCRLPDTLTEGESSKASVLLETLFHSLRSLEQDYSSQIAVVENVFGGQ